MPAPKHNAVILLDALLSGWRDLTILVGTGATEPTTFRAGPVVDLGGRRLVIVEADTGLMPCLIATVESTDRPDREILMGVGELDLTLFIEWASRMEDADVLLLADQASRPDQSIPADTDSAPSPFQLRMMADRGLDTPRTFMTAGTLIENGPPYLVVDPED